MRPAIAAIAFVALFCLGGEARSADVDLEVILAADVSRSIDDAEFDLQRKGYAAALTDPRVLAAIHGRSGERMTIGRSGSPAATSCRANWLAGPCRDCAV